MKKIQPGRKREKELADIKKHYPRLSEQALPQGKLTPSVAPGYGVDFYDSQRD